MLNYFSVEKNACSQLYDTPEKNGLKVLGLHMKFTKVEYFDVKYNVMTRIII